MSLYQRPIYDKYYFYMKMLICSDCAVIRLITAIGANRVPWRHPRGVSMSGRFQELWEISHYMVYKKLNTLII